MRQKSDETIFLYLIEVLTFGAAHPIKVGISKNIEERCKQLEQRGLCVQPLAYFIVEGRQRAQRVEATAHRAFPVCKRYGHYSREILDATFDEIVAFLRPRVFGSALYKFKDRL